MCGIAGFDFKPGSLSEGKRALLANVLGHLNDDRGGHSWGMVGFADNGEFEVKKGLGKIGANAYELTGYNRLFLHTRFATHGARTVENAHPFEIGNAIGAHNGIIYNHRELLTKYKREHEVDSMHLFAHLNEGKDFSDIEGYGSIEWIYMDDPTNILISRMRNGDLAMYGVGDDPHNTDGVIWSSREDHLVKALKVAGINNAFRYTADEGAVYSITNGNVYVTQMRADLCSRTTYGGTNSYTWENYRTGKVDDEVVEFMNDWRKDKRGNKRNKRGAGFVMKSAEDSAQILLSDTSTIDKDWEDMSVDELKTLSSDEISELLASGELDANDLIELGVIVEDAKSDDKPDDKDESKDENTYGRNSIHDYPESDVDVDNGEEWHKFCQQYAREAKGG